MFYFPADEVNDLLSIILFKYYVLLRVFAFFLPFITTLHLLSSLWITIIIVVPEIMCVDTAR